MPRKIPLVVFFKVTGCDIFSVLLLRVRSAIDVISFEIFFREITEFALWAAERKCFKIGDFEVIK